jgi:hypothetical protein
MNWLRTVSSDEICFNKGFKTSNYASRVFVCLFACLLACFVRDLVVELC